MMNSHIVMIEEGEEFELPFMGLNAIAAQRSPGITVNSTGSVSRIELCVLSSSKKFPDWATKWRAFDTRAFIQHVKEQQDFAEHVKEQPLLEVHQCFLKGGTFSYGVSGTGAPSSMASLSDTTLYLVRIE